MFTRLILCTLVVGALGAPALASARDTPAPQASSAATKAPQMSPQLKAAIEKQNQVLVRYAAEIAMMVDRGQVAQVWNASSEIAKRAVPQAAFVKSTEADRAQLGTVTSRKLQDITRGVSNGKAVAPSTTALPAGYYVNISFATQFSKYAKPVRELVSFHLDQDRTWRLSGYTVH